MWLAIEARGPRRDCRVAGRYGSAVGAIRSQIEEMVELSFGGRAWLARGFPAGSVVDINVWPHGESSAAVGKIRTKWGAIKCDLLVPASWFDEPGDGLLILRLFQATLMALRSIGDRYGIGVPAMRRSGSSRGVQKITDLFSPPKRSDAYAAEALELEVMQEDMQPRQMLAVAHLARSASLAAKQEKLVRAIGQVEVDRVIKEEGSEGVRVWVIRAI